MCGPSITNFVMNRKYVQNELEASLNLPIYSSFFYQSTKTFVFFQRYLNKPSGNVGIYDPAEIHNRSELKGFLKEAMIKLGFHLISFFLYLYR